MFQAGELSLDATGLGGGRGGVGGVAALGVGTTVEATDVGNGRGGTTGTCAGAATAIESDGAALGADADAAAAGDELATATADDGAGAGSTFGALREHPSASTTVSPVTRLKISSLPCPIGPARVTSLAASLGAVDQTRVPEA